MILPKSLVSLRQTLLDTQTKKAAWDIIEEYFSFFGPGGMHQELWILTAGLLTNDEMEQVENGRGRHNIIFFFEFTKMFAEEVHLLNSKRKKNEQTAKTIKTRHA